MTLKNNRSVHVLQNGQFTSLPSSFTVDRLCPLRQNRDDRF